MVKKLAFQSYTNFVIIAVVVEKIKYTLKRKKMSAAALVITIKDRNQNCPPHGSRHFPSPLGSCP